MPYNLFQLSLLSLPFCNQYLIFLCNIGFNLMILFFKVLYFCFQLVYKSVLILDECSSLIILPHQPHYKINVAIIFKIYLFTWFYQFSMVCLISPKIFWQPSFMRLSPYFLGGLVRFLLCLYTKLLF